MTPVLSSCPPAGAGEAPADSPIPGARAAEAPPEPALAPAPAAADGGLTSNSYPPQPTGAWIRPGDPALRFRSPLATRSRRVTGS